MWRNVILTSHNPVVVIYYNINQLNIIYINCQCFLHSYVVKLMVLYFSITIYMHLSLINNINRCLRKWSQSVLIGGEVTAGYIIFNLHIYYAVPTYICNVYTVLIYFVDFHLQNMLVV